MKQPTVSQLDHNWRVFVTISVVLMLTLSGIAGIFGPERWFSSMSLQGLRDLIHVPWCVVGIIFIIDAILIGYPRTRLLGWMLGVAMSGLFAALSIVFVILTRDFTNPFASVLLLLVPLLFMSGARGVVRDEA